MLKYHASKMAGYFEHNGYERIAVYGMTPLADCLYEELKDTDVHIEYFIDKNFDKSGEPTRAGIDVVGIEGAIIHGNIDVIIVTVISQIDNIKKSLRHVGIEIPIIPISEVIMYYSKIHQ